MQIRHDRHEKSKTKVVNGKKMIKKPAGDNFI